MIYKTASINIIPSIYVINVVKYICINAKTSHQSVRRRVTVLTLILCCIAVRVTEKKDISMYAVNESYLLPDSPIRRHPNGTLVNVMPLENVLFRTLWLLFLGIIVTVMLCVHFHIRRRVSMQS